MIAVLCLIDSSSLGLRLALIIVLKVLIFIEILMLEFKTLMKGEQKVRILSALGTRLNRGTVN